MCGNFFTLKDLKALLCYFVYQAVPILVYYKLKSHNFKREGGGVTETRVAFHRYSPKRIFCEIYTSEIYICLCFQPLYIQLLRVTNQYLKDIHRAGKEEMRIYYFLYFDMLPCYLQKCLLTIYVNNVRRITHEIMILNQI